MILLAMQMIFLMFLLIVNGEPLRFYLLRPLRLFSDMDLIQICILDIYLGGLILYVIAMLPFMLFNWFVIVGLTILCLILSVFVHSKALKQITGSGGVKAFLKDNRTASFDYLFVFAIFIIFLFVDLSALSNFVFGGIFDESIHSLKTEVILENKFVPLTLQPYLPEGIIYPQASHVFFAFAHYALNAIVPKAVFSTTILFKALSVFGAYFLGKKLGSARIYPLGLSLVFVFISSWPLFVVWGGNPFLVGFALFLVCLGLLLSLVRSPTKSSFGELVAVGLLFGLSGAIIISYLQTLVMIASIVLIYWFAKKFNSLCRKAFEFFVIFSVSLLVLAPFLFRFFVFYQYQGHNIGLPADFSEYPTQQFAATQALQWAFENLSPHFALRLLTLFLLAGLAILVWINHSYKNVKSVVAFASVIFTAATSLSIVSFSLPKDFEVISWGHQGIIIAISLNILLLAFYVEFVRFYQSNKLRSFHKFFSKSLHVDLMSITTIFILITAPFVYYRILIDPQALSGTYRIFAVTTTDDYKLMTWMEGNVSSDAVILVSLFEPGLFIPTISHHKIVYPYSGSSFSHSYQTLLDLLESNALNETAYDLALNLSVSHIYVGSDGAYWWFKKHKWDPELFLGNPNFKLVKSFGDAYLFQFNCTLPDVVLLDDFEHECWDDYGWQAYFDGNGLGNVTIVNGFENYSRCLKMTSQAIPTVSSWKCAYYTVREVYVQNDSDVTLSFRFNATEGFHSDDTFADTFAVLVSNIYRNQSIVITTPNGVYQDYSHAISLSEFEGFFEDINLSVSWNQWFNCSFPNPFILEFVNWDFDGVENVVYIDNIKVTSTPLR